MSNGYTTNVPSPVWGPNGLIIPTEEQIFEGEMADIQAAFVAALSQNLITPQGQIASSNTAIIGSIYNLLLYYTTQVDPAYAQGRMQDGIGRIYFQTRKGANATAVICTLSGDNILIPANSLATDTSGNIYYTLEDVTISERTATAVFYNQQAGPIPCAAGTLNKIYKAIPGWDSIINPADGELGNNTESQQQFEWRREASVAGNSAGAAGSIRGALLSTLNVTDAYVYNNGSSSPFTIGGRTIDANSIYCCVAGGTAQDVGDAIYSKIGGGCQTTGTTSVTVYDTQEGMVPPYPSYTINFDIATPYPIYFQVTIPNGTQVPANATILIQNAIVNAFGGGDEGIPAKIGSNIYATRYASPVGALGSWAQVESIYIGTASDPTSGLSLSVPINSEPVIAPANITVIYS